MSLLEVSPGKKKRDAEREREREVFVGLLTFK